VGKLNASSNKLENNTTNKPDEVFPMPIWEVMKRFVITNFAVIANDSNTTEETPSNTLFLEKNATA
ncbi:MAG: hypothetical protein COY47_00140, partial [Chloroflexi bacterium CG_4_10_14_0_8_um_filter_57_5]